jgi:hypothetical protein
MKNIFFIIFSLLVNNAFAILPYEGDYILSADTKMGSFQMGKAVLKLEVNEDQFKFTTEAETDVIWKALYDYSRSEESSGRIVDGQIINNYFSVLEKDRNKVQKNYEINILTDENYAISSLGEKWEIKNGLLVDPLSVYLALSNDMMNDPTKSEFVYQVIDEDGVNFLKFKIAGPEIISINKNDILTVQVYCEELQLTLNLSLNDNFQPVRIKKINGKTEFTLLLIEFKKSLL